MVRCIPRLFTDLVVDKLVHGITGLVVAQNRVVFGRPEPFDAWFAESCDESSNGKAKANDPDPKQFGQSKGTCFVVFGIKVMALFRNVPLRFIVGEL